MYKVPLTLAGLACADHGMGAQNSFKQVWSSSSALSPRPPKLVDATNFDLLLKDEGTANAQKVLATLLLAWNPAVAFYSPGTRHDTFHLLNNVPAGCRSQQKGLLQQSMTPVMDKTIFGHHVGQLMRQRQRKKADWPPMQLLCSALCMCVALASGWPQQRVSNALHRPSLKQATFPSMEDMPGIERRQLVMILGMTSASIGALAHADSSDPTIHQARDSGSRLLKENPAMAALSLRFSEAKKKLQRESGLDKQEAIKASLSLITEFFASNNNVWGEIGPLGTKEKGIWNSFSVKSSPDSLQTVNLQFLQDYYAFWKGFNSFFDTLILSLDGALPQMHNITAIPEINALVELERQGASKTDNVVRLKELFADIMRVRRGTGPKTQPSMAVLPLPKERLAQSVPIISSFCEDGKYSAGLGSLIDMQVDLLEALRAEDARAISVKVPGIAKVLNLSPETPKSVATCQIAELLYQSQGVFLFVNAFQQQVVDDLLRPDRT